MEYLWKFMSNKKHVNWFFFNMNFHELTMNFFNGKNKLYVQLILNRYLRIISQLKDVTANSREMPRISAVYISTTFLL